MRTYFNVNWPVRVINGGRSGISLDIDWSKMCKIYPFLKDANFRLTAVNVDSRNEKKRKKSREEQAKMYRKLLRSGKVKNKAGLARKFGVSRAWITKVLSS